MKVNLVNNSRGLLSGYINVDPAAQKKIDPYEIVCEAYNNLNAVAEDNECTELIANDVVDFIEPRDVLNTIKHWASKIRLGGSLTITGVDLLEVARSLVYGKFTNQEGKTLPLVEQIQTANVLLHHITNDIWNRRYHNLSLSVVLSIVGELPGFRVIYKNVSDNRYLVKAIRER